MRNIAYRFVTASRPRASSISDRAGFFPTGSAQASPICSAPPTEFFTARQASNSSGPSPESRFHFALTTRSTRSEEHTSELQSRRDLVCRLLLEKKKKKK